MLSRILESPHPQRVAPAIWKTINNGPVRPVPSPEHQAAIDEQKLKEAYQKGYAEGVAAARAQFEAQVSEVLQKVSGTIAQVSQLPQQIREAGVQNLVSLAIATASRILNREITIDPDAIQGLVTAAVEKMQTRDIHRVKLHASHETTVRKALSQILPGNTIEIAAEASLKPGDIIFETQLGSTDASITTQLQEIERGLADRMTA